MITGAIPTIFVTDMNRSLEFYVTKLGLELIANYGGHWAEVKAGDVVYGLHPKGEVAVGDISVGLSVTDIEGEVARIEAAGIEVPNGVRLDADAHIKLADFRDPDGHSVYFCEQMARH